MYGNSFQLNGGFLFFLHETGGKSASRTPVRKLVHFPVRCGSEEEQIKVPGCCIFLAVGDSNLFRQQEVKPEQVDSPMGIRAADLLSLFQVSNLSPNLKILERTESRC